MRLLSKLRFRWVRIAPAGRPEAEGINNRTQKSPVNPLTRLASRSEIRRNIQSPHVEGPAATFDPSLD